MYTRLFNLADNSFKRYCNVLILLNEPHCHHFYLHLFCFNCFQIISLFKALNVYIFIKELSTTVSCFFKDITKIIKKFATEYDPSSNSML